jgi:predicted nucleic acid-binding protein
MSDTPQFYWDTCVFIAHLNSERAKYGTTLDDIAQYLDEAREGKCIIHCSAITIAEVTKEKMVDPAKWQFTEFLRDFSDAVIPVFPDINVMALAAELRSLKYTKTGGERKLGTPDAIHLASAIILQDVYGVTLDAFHTFDNGGKRDPETNSKGVPLLSYETWCEQCLADPIARKVINLKRVRPEHPAKQMFTAPPEHK